MTGLGCSHCPSALLKVRSRKMGITKGQEIKVAKTQPNKQGCVNRRKLGLRVAGLVLIVRPGNGPQSIQFLQMNLSLACIDVDRLGRVAFHNRTPRNPASPLM